MSNAWTFITIGLSATKFNQTFSVTFPDTLPYRSFAAIKVTQNKILGTRNFYKKINSNNSFQSQRFKIYLSSRSLRKLRITNRVPINDKRKLKERERERGIEINEISSKGESKQRVINTWFNITRLPLVSSHHHRTPFDFCLHSIPPHCTRPTRCVHTRPGIYTTSSSPLLSFSSLRSIPIPFHSTYPSFSFLCRCLFFFFSLRTSCRCVHLFFALPFFISSLSFSQRVKERGRRVATIAVCFFPFDSTRPPGGFRFISRLSIYIWFILAVAHHSRGLTPRIIPWSLKSNARLYDITTSKF